MCFLRICKSLPYLPVPRVSSSVLKSTSSNNTHFNIKCLYTRRGRFKQRLSDSEACRIIRSATLRPGFFPDLLSWLSHYLSWSPSRQRPRGKDLSESGFFWKAILGKAGRGAGKRGKGGGRKLLEPELPCTCALGQ